MDATRELLQLRASRLQMVYLAIHALACDPVNAPGRATLFAIAGLHGGYNVVIGPEEAMTLTAFKALPQIERDLAQANRDLANYVFATR